MKPLFRLPIFRSATRDMDDEFAFHLDMRTQELIAKGWSPAAARTEAQRQFGDLDDARTYCRNTDKRRGKRLMRAEYLTELRQDIGFAFRALRRSPAFTLVAALTLALGIGANTAIFSVVRGILLRPLPFHEPDRLMLVVSEANGKKFPYTSPANAVDWQNMNHSFTSLAVTTSHSAVLTGAGEPENLRGFDVGRDFFGGVVGDVKQSSLAATTKSQFWAASDQWPVSSMTVVIHSARNLDAVVADARRVVHELDPDLAVAQVKTLDEIMADSVAQPRFYMILLGAFAAVAILLSSIGIYGVIAYLVGQRSREIGIRMALGASRGRVMRMVVQEGTVMTSAGIGLGLLGALALTRLMTALLFGITPTDPITYVLVTVILAGVALAASWVPALRAARVDPALTMRAE
jgi:hypothetical protein